MGILTVFIVICRMFLVRRLRIHWGVHTYRWVNFIRGISQPMASPKFGHLLGIWAPRVERDDKLRWRSEKATAILTPALTSITQNIIRELAVHPLQTNASIGV